MKSIDLYEWRKESGLWATKGLNRLIIEKPFGYNVTSAREFSAKLIEYFDKNDIYYNDHYLWKWMVTRNTLRKVLRNKSYVIQDIFIDDNNLCG